MRTQALACAVFAAALAPSFVTAAPHPALGTYEADIKHLASGGSTLSSLKTPRSVPAVGKYTADIKPLVSGGTLVPAHAVAGRALSPLDHLEESDMGGVMPIHVVESRREPMRGVVGTVVTNGTPKIGPRRLSKRALDSGTAGGNAYSGSSGNASGGSTAALSRMRFANYPRTDDADTLGGNAYTGSSGDVSGGSIENIANDGMPTIMNVNSNNAGAGGTSSSGCASGGYTATTTDGAGGNAYSGSAGNAAGGSVSNVGGMVNMDSNNGGAAGTSASGCATGGDVGTGQVTNTAKDTNDDLKDYDFDSDPDFF